MRKNNLPLHLVLLNSIILLLTSSGCVRYDIQDDDTKPPDSEKIERVLDEIEKRGFCLDIELYRTGVSTRIQALYDERGRIDIIYDWRINDREVKKEVFYSNNQLFIKETGIWEESVKSERFPHEIVQTVTSFGNFLYLGRRGGSFIYEFTPNLMFLSPVIEETEAKINLDIKTLNPQYIEAKGKDVYFKAIFEGFGDNIRIDHPLSEIYRADISPVPNEIDLSSIKRRLLDTGADDCWIENSSLYIKTFQIDKGILRRVLQKGTLYIFTAKYLRESRDETKEKYGERVVM